MELKTFFNLIQVYRLMTLQWPLSYAAYVPLVIHVGPTLLVSLSLQVDQQMRSIICIIQIIYTVYNKLYFVIRTGTLSYLSTYQVATKINIQFCNYLNMFL